MDLRELLTIDVPGMPGYQLHHFGRSFTTEEGLSVLHDQGRKSPGLDVLVELRKKFPKLYELPDVAVRLKECGYSGLYVLSGLEEDYEWYDPRGRRLVSGFYSYPGDCYLHLRCRDDKWGSHGWLLSVASN